MLIKNLKSTLGGQHRKSDFFPDFLPIFNSKRQWETRGELGVSREGEKPNIKQMAKKKKKVGQKKKLVKKSQKSVKSEKI